MVAKLPHKSLAGWILLLLSVLVGFSPAPILAREIPKLDQRRLQKVGIHAITGKHILLLTDLPPSDEIDQLPVVFDAAVDQWAEYFEIPARNFQHWQMRAYLIQDRNKFKALNLLPKQQPDFINGFATAQELWLNEQPSNYYRRHLLLHEGTHGFMHALVGDVGPAWYAEGMAELFGTHTWYDDKLAMRHMPGTKQSVPMWGRIKSIREAYEAGEALSLEAVLKLDGRRSLTTEQYAWCWALCKFLDSHPHWQKKFHQMHRYVRDDDFNSQFRKMLNEDWPDLLIEWQAFISDLDYGYDCERMLMQHKPSENTENLQTIEISAEQGWQSTGRELESGKKYSVTAQGRYLIAQKEKPWPCEPGGVTLQYHNGFPLGMLIGAWRTPSGRFSSPFPIGLKTTLKPAQTAKLYLRVNESPAELSDNQGSLRVRFAVQKEDDD